MLQNSIKIPFSVLIPVYIKESPSSLESALQSILEEQTVVPDEVVIVEDGPITPELERVLEEFQARFGSRIKRYKLDQNQGMGIAMNYGLINSSFDWIARMDSDDIAVRDRFERQVKFLQNNPTIDVLGSSIEEFNIQPGDMRRFRTLPQENDQIVRMMKFRNPINHMTVFFRKDMALRAGGYWSHRYNEDYNLWYEMQKIGAKFHNLTENLVHARVGNNMVRRRSGYSYFLFERILLKKFFSDRFITPFEYAFLLLVKFSLRILPTRLLEMFYKSFLRKSS
ncbi:MAG TPA: glycosyltransferase [Chitinophagaceae bacterium]